MKREKRLQKGYKVGYKSVTKFFQFVTLKKINICDGSVTN